MSVTIEGTSLVAVRCDLEEAFPGGAAAFVEVAQGEVPTSTLEQDEQLVRLALRERDDAYALAALMPEKVQWVLVDEATGPFAPVSWMRWSNRNGTSRAWLAGTRTRRKAGAEKPELIELAVEDGVATYLDLGTGTQIQTELPAPVEVNETPIHDALIAAIEEIGWSHHDSGAPAAMVDLEGTCALYSSRLYANEVGNLLVCYTRAPMLVPLPARRRVMDFISRANYGMQHGNFEMSLDQGVLGFRTSTLTTAASLNEEVVRGLLLWNISALDRYMPSLMEVVYAKRTPREAVDAAEQG